MESLKLDQLKRNSTVPELNSNSKFIRGYRDKFFMVLKQLRKNELIYKIECNEESGGTLQKPSSYINFMMVKFLCLSYICYIFFKI